MLTHQYCHFVPVLWLLNIILISPLSNSPLGALLKWTVPQTFFLKKKISTYFHILKSKFFPWIKPESTSFTQILYLVLIVLTD